MSQILQNMWDGIVDFAVFSLILAIAAAVVIAGVLLASGYFFGQVVPLTIVGAFVVVLVVNSVYQAVRSR